MIVFCHIGRVPFTVIIRKMGIDVHVQWNLLLRTPV